LIYAKLFIYILSFFCKQEIFLHIMNDIEAENIPPEKTITEIFGSQKVKLYKIKHFLFDFGGVMAGKSFAFKNFLDCMKQDLKINACIEEEPSFKKTRRRLSSGRITAREFLDYICEEYYYSCQEKEKEGALPSKKVNIDYYLELWFELYSRFIHLSSEMEEIVTRLHKAGYVVSLVSNTYDIHAKSNELRGFFKLFDNVFLSNEIGIIKPDVKKYKYVMKKLDSKPKECIFIDDKLRNLITAREYGIYVIKFESIEKFKRQLTALGIPEITKDLRQEIKNKYKDYEGKKKEYKKAKKELKKAKKKKKKSFSKKIDYQVKQVKYKKKKKKYKEGKEVKKKELIKDFDLT